MHPSEIDEHAERRKLIKLANRDRHTAEDVANLLESYQYLLSVGPARATEVYEFWRMSFDAVD
ncbi:helix-turn-helix DNA binding domain protein [Microbacterium phage Cece]|nr:helix-turn-helix DNA binding domain protein [Microbacterium phage Cece]UVG35314.1 helix-turn-helix DNA binding domain protein [Microbacterium phage Cece]